MTDQKLNKSELHVLRSCAEHVRDQAPDPYSELWDIEHSVFCLHSVMFDSLAEKLTPLLPTKKRWVKRREGQFLIFTCAKGDSRGAVRSLLQSTAAKARRRAREARAEGHHLPAHYRELWEIQNGRCYFSGEALGTCFEDREFAVDHLTPLAVRSAPFGGIAGTNWPTNLALVTKRVNAMKGGDDAETFLWRLKNQPRRYRYHFTPTSQRERTRIDRLRSKRFASYMKEEI